MSSRPFDLQVHISRHGAALRQLAADLLQDAGAADDAVQETWLRALRRPPRHETSVGGWLATLLRNVASSMRRAQRRRVQREGMAARSEVVEDQAMVLAREQQVHRLVTAVTALPAPLREAIWQRYFEGLLPREIAAASGEPLATVKSRLQRGLQQLRGDLGDASDWRPALTGAFALLPATKGTGVLTAMAVTKAMMAVGVVAALGLLVWTLRESESPTPAGNAATVAAGVDRKADHEPAVAAALVAQPSDISRVPAAAVPANATIRGRLVDPGGVPLAGVKVKLSGRGAFGDRMDAWLAAHGTPPQWQNPAPQTTAEAGTFSFAFVPPPPFLIEIEITAAMRVGKAGMWDRVTEGQEINLGDVVLVPGIKVTGNVVDEQGKAIAGVRVRQLMNPFGSGNTGPLRSDTVVAVTADAGGRFENDKQLPPEQYLVTVEGWELVRPVPLIVLPEPAVQDVTLVVRPAPEVLTISGSVVDDAGAPVEGASISVDDDSFFMPSGRAGRFELKRRRDLVRGDARIHVRSLLCEPLDVEPPVPWGTRGVVLRMQRGGALSVHVTDAAGAPVTAFAVRLPPLGRAEGNSEYGRVRVRGPFADGVATIPSVPVGKWLVWVELPEGSEVPAVIAPIEMPDHSPRRIDLRVLEARRTLRVVDAAGAPVAGSKVRVADAVAGPIANWFGYATAILPLAQFVGASAAGGKAVLLVEATTDAAGTVVLRGPTDRSVTVLIEGPGHLPQVCADVHLVATGDLVVTVGKGGSVTGRIVPPEGLVELRRLAGLPAEGPIPAASAAAWARVSIWFGDGTSGATGAIDADGRFAVHGVPPGAGSTLVAAGQDMVSTAGVVVRDAETSTVDLDVSALLPGTLTAEATWNGVPLADEALQLSWRSPSPFREQGDVASCAVKTDAQGRFEHRGRPGTYQLSLWRPGRGQVLSLRAPTSAVVVRDQTTHHVFAIESGRLMVTLLDHDGRSATLECLLARSPDRSRGGTLTREDVNGPYCGHVPPGEYDLVRAPASQVLGMLMSLPGMNQPAYDAQMRRLEVKVGSASVVVGQTTTLELRLPVGK